MPKPSRVRKRITVQTIAATTAISTPMLAPELPRMPGRSVLFGNVSVCGAIGSRQAALMT